MIVQKIITVDGLSASGKGTVALLVAQKLGWDYLDSGALYRVVAWLAREQGLAWLPENEARLAQLAQDLPIEFRNHEIVVHQQLVGEVIRSAEIGQGASLVGKMPLVRTALLQRQRDFATPKGLVTDGRDMGSVIFPQAMLKIYLTADLDTRAMRRHLQQPHRSLQEVRADLAQRDEQDRNRAVAPLLKQADMVEMDNTNLKIEEVVAQIIDLYQAKLK